jgi:hypothetical protein
MGVYSPSENAPIKSGNFLRRDEALSDARSYADWKFVYTASMGAVTKK